MRRYKLLIVLLGLGLVIWNQTRPETERPQRQTSSGSGFDLANLGDALSQLMPGSSNDPEESSARSNAANETGADRPSRSDDGTGDSQGASGAAGVSTSAQSTTNAEGKPPWLPSEVGRRWTYSYVRERTRGSGNTSPAVEKFVGILTEEITRFAREFGGEVVELQSTLRRRDDSQDPDKVETTRRFIVTQGEGVRELARETADAHSGELELRHYPPYVELITATTEEPSRWQLGAWKPRGRIADFTGELLGLHDANTPAGSFPNCMVVRYSADLAAGISKSGARRGGSIVITEWYAPGVGKVMAKEQVSESTTFADGRRSVFEEEIRYALSLAEFESAPPASPAPSAAGLD